MLNGIFKNLGMVAYPVSNWQNSKKFYQETLSLPVAAFISDDVGWMEFGEKDQTHLAISFWGRPEPMPVAYQGGAVAVFSVDDAYEAVKKLRERGVKCDEVVSIPKMVTYADFYDPDGNRLQIYGPPPKE